MRQEYLIFAALIILLLAAFFLFRRFRKRIRSGRYAPPKGRTLRVSLESGDYGRMAEILLLGLGGESNVSSAEAGGRRLRIGIRDYDRVDQEKLESSGVIGVLRPSKICGLRSDGGGGLHVLSHQSHSEFLRGAFRRSQCARGAELCRGAGEGAFEDDLHCLYDSAPLGTFIDPHRDGSREALAGAHGLPLECHRVFDDLS